MKGLTVMGNRARKTATPISVRLSTPTPVQPIPPVKICATDTNAIATRDTR